MTCEQMTEKQILDLALEEGFAEAAVIDTAQIAFDFSFRKYCEENICGQYGANHSCPPDCGTPEEMMLRIMMYKKALVLKTNWEIADFRDAVLVKAAKQGHIQHTFNLANKLREVGLNGLIIGASGCFLCSPCSKIEGKPCNFPDMQYSCTSAYCVNVMDLTQKGGMNYEYKDGILPFFGMYVFDVTL